MEGAEHNVKAGSSCPRYRLKSRNTTPVNKPLCKTRFIKSVDSFKPILVTNLTYRRLAPPHVDTPQVSPVSLKHESQLMHIQEKIILELSLLTLPPIPHHLPPLLLCIWFWMEQLSIFKIIRIMWYGGCAHANIFT